MKLNFVLAARSVSVFPSDCWSSDSFTEKKNWFTTFNRGTNKAFHNVYIIFIMQKVYRLRLYHLHQHLSTPRQLTHSAGFDGQCFLSKYRLYLWLLSKIIWRLIILTKVSNWTASNLWGLSHLSRACYEQRATNNIPDQSPSDKHKRTKGSHVQKATRQQCNASLRGIFMQPGRLREN